jgi:hypothetical protein
MAEVIIVLGMHRSGTSSVAGVLTKLGGVAPGTLFPPDSGNARGYFESAHFMHLHDELLASAGSCWDDWRKFNPAWYRSPAADSYKRRAKEIFEAEFANATLPILNLPICTLLARRSQGDERGAADRDSDPFAFGSRAFTQETKRAVAYQGIAAMAAPCARCGSTNTALCGRFSPGTNSSRTGRVFSTKFPWTPVLPGLVYPIARYMKLNDF